MSHKLLKLKQSVVNTPQLITQESFSTILEYLNNRNSDGFKLEGADSGGSEYLVKGENGTAVINLSGTLTYKPMFDFATCGDNVSYQSLKGTFKDLVKDGYKNIAMIIDSGGGEAHGCFDSANYIRSLLDEQGVKLTAYVDGISGSAAYALTSIADEIVMSADSEVGSIGVVVQMINNSKALEKAGYERTFVYSGESKVPFDNDGKFTQDFLSKIQKGCDEKYEEFINHISIHRGIDKEVVRGTQANMFNAKEAIELGLADKVMTYEEFMSYLADKAPNMNGGSVNYLSKFMKTDQTGDVAMSLETQLKTKEEELLHAATALSDAQKVSKELEAKLSETVELLSAKEDVIKQLTSQVEEMKEQALAVQLASRKEKLSAVLPEDQVEAQLAAIGGLPEEQFNAVLSAMSGLKQANASSEMFTEMGDAGQPVEELTDDQKLEALTAQKLKSK